MAIAPPSDLVLDVLRAADPVQQQQATAKLAQLAGAKGSSLAFADAMQGAGSSEPGYFRALTHPAGVDEKSSIRAAGAGASAPSDESPLQKFEAMVLQQFVQSMLPDDAAEVFGEGATGEIWKSMLAEQVGNQLAAAGGIGLASLLTDSLKEQTRV